MGGLLHFFDFNQASTSRKSLKKHDGLEAPRNSMELRLETLQCYDAVGENIPFAHQVNQSFCKRNCSPNGAPMKKLIYEEITKEPDARRNVPSVVARLMGMDMLPSDTKPTIHMMGKQNDITEKNFSRTEQARNCSVHHSPLGLKNDNQRKYDVPFHGEKEDSDQLSNILKFEKPRPREHPQEEQLQKFKKEFEAWQAARVWEQSRVTELGSIPRQWLAKEHLQKEKMAHYAASKSVTVTDIPEFEPHAPLPTLKKVTQDSRGFQYHESKRESSEEYQKEAFSLGNRSKTCEVEQIFLTHNDEKQGKSSVPTRIVILKPGPDRITSSEHSWAGSSEIVEDEGGIEGFLEEVKERLRFEMQGKSAKRDLVVRGSGIETPFSEKSSSPKQIARNIAKHARASVTKDPGMNLVRSESTRSYRSEVHVDEPGSPEFLHRDTRKLLSERLRNVLKEDTYLDDPSFATGSMRASMVAEGDRRKRTLDVWKREHYCGNQKEEQELQSSSFRHGQQNEVLHLGEISPRNLVRSMSAPVSGTSFRKLLLEDRHVLTGAQIRRRHEATESISMEVRKPRKEKFNFRGKVSNFRYRFTLKGRLFGRKIQSVEESWSNKSDIMKDMMSGPTVITNFGSARENSTEVPPSPASMCSSLHEEFYRTAEHPSPISTLDVPMIEDHAVPQAFRDISSNLHELRRQLNQLEFGMSEDIAKVEEPFVDEMIELEGQAEAYIKDLLIVSGLYDGSSVRPSLKLDTSSKPINNWVFDKVEESYKKRPEEDVTKDHTEFSVDHKVLFDLLNEALPVILGTSVTMSTFKRKVIGPTLKQTPCRKELMDVVWRMIRNYVYPPCDGSFYSLDGIIARDLCMNPWSDMIHGDGDVIGREMENLILGELIEETLRDMWS